MLTRVHHLVGVAEIARMLGVNRQRAHAITVQWDDWPSPQAVLLSGQKIWHTEDVIACAERHGRTIHWRPGEGDEVSES